MGAYLSEPVIEKYSNDEGNEYMDIGASSMQGWRISQEDAHNCILNFDKNTSLFAVYDGHGGAEVAAYCAEKLPEFLKQLKAYKEGDFEQALKDAFLGIDTALLDEEVIEILKKLAVEKNPDKESELAEEEEEEDLVELCQEGCLPIEEVLEKYRGCAGRFPQLIRLRKDDSGGASGSGTSKPLSPFLRGRRNPVVEICEENMDSPSCSSTQQKAEIEAKKSDSESTDTAVSSSSSKNDNSIGKTDAANKKKDTVTSQAPETDKVSNSSNSDMTSTTLHNNNIQNGDISSCEEREAQPSVSNKNEVSSSSCIAAEESPQVPLKQENGEVSSASPPSSNKSKQPISGSPSNITSSTNEGKCKKSLNPTLREEDDTSSSDDDADFHAEENSSTEDGEEDGEGGDDDTEEENEDEETEDEDGPMDDNFCTGGTEEPGKDSGCTAVVAILSGRDLYVANAGDSRCVVCRNGKAIEMSQDHKPEDEEECARIFKAGGKVTMDGRVNGGLNLSRAIGDHSYKMNKELPPEMQMISAMPDVRNIAISPDDEFMILACDGIWNFMSSDEVIEFVKKRITGGREKLSQICEEV